ncbi:MAG: ArsR/SmtB family transcription factor [Promethearchaeota archaeon]
MMRLMELLADPVRSRIYFEVMRQGEITAQELMAHVDVNRSTLTHHLTKLVAAKALRVRVQELGRPVKYYRLNEEIQEEVVIGKETGSVEALKQRIAFLESAVAHLQMITNLAREAALQRRSELEETTRSEKTAERTPRRRTQRQVCFTFLLLSDKEVLIWNQEYNQFLKTVNEKLQGTRRKTQKTKQPKHVAFAGLLPLSN